MKIFSRITAAALASILLMSALISCGAPNGSTAAPNETATADNAAGGTPEQTVPETAAELKPDLPETDFGGYEFRFLNGNSSSWMTVFVVTAEEQNGEVVNDAIYARNLAVSEKYGVKISEIPTGNMENSIKKSVAAADNSFDVALLTMGSAVKSVEAGAATDYAAIPHIDLEKPVVGAERPQNTPR